MVPPYVFFTLENLKYAPEPHVKFIVQEYTSPEAGEDRIKHRLVSPNMKRKYLMELV